MSPQRLAAAGIVPEGTTSGERMHKARDTTGQRVLDTTGNLKAVQKLLGPRLHPNDRRQLRRLGHQPARRDDGQRARQRRRAR